MTKTLLSGSVALLIALPGPCEAENMVERGNYSCDPDYAENLFKEDPDDIGNRVHYAACLVIAGEDGRGLPELYYLADHHSSVTASFYLADYLRTDGKLAGSITETKVNEAIKYYLHTLAVISSIAQYPEPDYFFHEKNDQMELNSIYRAAFLYLRKYWLGMTGHECELVKQWNPGMAAECSVHTEYNRFMSDSLDKAFMHAKRCSLLPQKWHFNPARYTATVEACGLLSELASRLVPVEEQRWGVLLQPACEDATGLHRVWEGQQWEACPEYSEIRKNIYDLIVRFSEEAKAAFDRIDSSSGE